MLLSLIPLTIPKMKDKENKPITKRNSICIIFHIKRPQRVGFEVIECPYDLYSQRRVLIKYHSLLLAQSHPQKLSVSLL